MTRYIEILSRQRPFPFNVDENGRTMFSANYDAQAAGPVADWEGEVAKLITAAGLGTAGVDLFIGPKAAIPVGNGPYITILDTGGRSPDETQNGSKYERMSVQIVVRAQGYTQARTRALAIWRLLDGKRGVTVTAA